ncbi:MAG TPA: uroporphyrinogen decarboxylase family protein [Halanaerobiales bacterium]|nr:uroporphyrinogen decarboxylase family protein [Halanaerobiales bacterium]
MNGKERIHRILRKKKTDKIPWVPFAGVHAGKLIGASAREVLQDEEILLEAVLEANKLYKPDGQPVIFDLQVEAEILGCELKWAENSPPTVVNHPLADSDQIPENIPARHEGRLPMIIRVMKTLKEEIGDQTALYGLICGPFTLALHLRGTNLFMDMINNPEYTRELLQYTLLVSKRISRYYIESGMDDIAAVDPMVSQISPAHFKEFLNEPYSDLFKYLREQGVLSSFFVCGDASRNIEEMCLTEPDSISVDENVDLATAKEITDRYQIVIGGNIPLTTVMLFGSQQDNMKWVLDLMDSLENTDRLIIAPGCDMPYDVPVDNTLAVEQAVHQTEQVREILANYEKVEEDIDIELPDYEKLEKALIEVFTLDSETCAACTYMMAAAAEAKKHFADRIELVEYKYTSRENIARVKKMGVKNLPSIYINGELAYASLVPNRSELLKRIEKCL